MFCLYLNRQLENKLGGDKRKTENLSRRGNIFKHGVTSGGGKWKLKPNPKKPKPNVVFVAKQPLIVLEKTGFVQEIAEWKNWDGKLKS